MSFIESRFFRPIKSILVEFLGQFLLLGQYKLALIINQAKQYIDSNNNCVAITLAKSKTVSAKLFQNRIKVTRSLRAPRFQFFNLFATRIKKKLKQKISFCF